MPNGRKSRAALAAALLLTCAAGTWAAEPPVPPLPHVAVRPIAVKMVVVANFEPGKDEGDAPGEFQFWVEREHLNEVIPIRAAPPVRRNKDGLYGIKLASLRDFILDPRFDFSKTYWLFTGISGVDPRMASVGSAAWAGWVVDGDALREVDDREIPKGWPYGLWPIGADRPDTLPTHLKGFAGQTDPQLIINRMVLALNRSLTDWAYRMTKDVVIPDTPALQKARTQWKGYANAQKPPFVLEGETLGSIRYWHGPGRTKWAEDWVKLWTRGQGTFVMTNMESQRAASVMKEMAAMKRVDLQRMLVLRTASNPSMPPPGVALADSVGDEAPGQIVAYEANYRAGVPVVHEILQHWSQYKDRIPGSP